MESRGVQQRCQNCGAMLSWNPESQSLRCDACGAVGAPSPAERTIHEQELSQGLKEARRGRLAHGTQTAKCTECGAAVEFTDGTTATRCSFCDAPMVLIHDERSRFLPQGVIPFAVGNADAVAHFRRWLGKLWFRPGDLRQRAQVAEIRGVYVPYWTFDAEVRSSWSAEAGWFYWEEERVFDPGQKQWVRRRVQKVRWQSASGQRADRYDDWLVCASRGVPTSLEAGAGKFGTEALRGWAPEYLAGFQAESYAVDLPEAWEAGRIGIGAEQSHRCEGDVPGDTHRLFSAHHTFTDVTWKHVLAPLWIAAFRYRERAFQFLVNGQTGVVAGEAPYSVGKIVAAVAAAIAFIAVAMVLWLRWS